MKTKLLALIVCISGIASADVNDFGPNTQITEQEVKSLITVGMDEKDVLKKAGRPTMTMNNQDGTQTWFYLTGPPRTATLSYSGFDVFFNKNKKVTQVGIARSKLKIPN